VKDQDLHPYKTGRTIFLFVLMILCVDSKLEDQVLWADWQQAFDEFSLRLISSFVQF
jgi:hypothetical protein